MLSRSRIEPMPTENQRVSGVKRYLKSYHLNPPTTVPHSTSKWRVIKHSKVTSMLRIGLLDLVILQKYVLLKQNKFIPVSLISF